MAFELGFFLVQFLVIVGGAALFRALARRVRQPPVLGEMLLGFLLGASILGVYWTDAYAWFFPAANRPLMEALGWIGLILFIYGVGADVQWDRREAWPIFFIASGGLMVPFVLGSVISLAKPQWFFPAGAGFENMILMGCIMSVSALAVLGRLLADMGLMHTRAAALSLGASTIDDIVAWILVSIIVGGHVGLAGNVTVNFSALAILFAVVMLVDRYAAPYFVKQAGSKAPSLFVVLLVVIFASAFITHEAGLHALIGAFAVGALMSQHPILKEYAQTRLNEMTNVLFLPAFFVLMGMNVDVTGLKFPEAAGVLGILVLVATVSKVVGAYIGGRAMGIDTYTCLQVGILLNNRGAVGLVVAKVGYDAGLLSAEGFALLVMMITFTTLISPFALMFLERFHRAARSATAAPA